MTDETPPPKKASKRWLRPLLVLGAIGYVAYILLAMAETSDYLFWPQRILFFLAVAWLVYVTFAKIKAANFTGKKIAFSLVLAGILYACVFVLCMVFVKLMAARDERLAETRTESLSEKTRHRIGKMLVGDHPGAYDREVGWVQRADYQWKNHYTNKQGLRGKRTYPETPADPEKRILCIGDSFTFGYEVDDDETFPHLGEQILPGTEWINLGICGTGLTQSLAQYRKNGRKFGGKHVVIAFMSNNGKRTVNCFRPFISPEDIMPFTQPHARLVDRKLSVEPNPFQDISDYQTLLDDEEAVLQRLYDLDYFGWSNQRASKNPIVRTLRYIWERSSGDHNLAVLLNRDFDTNHGVFRPSDDPYGSVIWHPKSPGLETNKQLFELYYDEVIADGRIPLIVLLPSAGDVEDRSNGLPPKYDELLKHFDEKGLRHFCFLDVLAERYGDELSAQDLYVRTHFNHAANQLLAEEIIDQLSLQ